MSYRSRQIEFNYPKNDEEFSIYNDFIKNLTDEEMKFLEGDTNCIVPRRFWDKSCSFWVDIKKCNLKQKMFVGKPNIKCQLAAKRDVWPKTDVKKTGWQFTNEERDGIIKLHEEGYSTNVIARTINVRTKHIANIIQKHKWKKSGKL